MINDMTLYSDTLASHSYRFKRLMLAYADTEIEQILREARLLFEKLDRVLDSPNEATEAYRLNIEKLVDGYSTHSDLALLKADIESQYAQLNSLIN